MNLWVLYFYHFIKHLHFWLLTVFSSSYSHYKCLDFWYWPTKCPCTALFIFQPLLINSFVCVSSIINYQVMLMRKLIPGNRRILNTEMVQILGHTSCQGRFRLSLGWRLSHKWKPVFMKWKTLQRKLHARARVNAWVYKWWYPFYSHTCTSHFPPTCLDIPHHLSVLCRSSGKCKNIWIFTTTVENLV